MTAMLRQHRSVALSLVGLAAVVVVLAGCGSSSNTTTSTKSSSTSSSSGAAGPYGAPPASTSTAASGGSAVDLATSKVGKILVNSKGLTLYLFVADTGTTSTCNGACAGAWPPLTTKGKPTAGAGVKASLLGTTKRSDGTTEVTYGGHPLYTYAGDTGPGQTTGQALSQFGALWYVVGANGAAIK